MNFSRIGFIGIFIIYFFLQAEGQSTEVIIKVKDTVSVGVPFILEIELKIFRVLSKLRTLMV